MRVYEDSFSGQKIYPGKGKLYVRGDSKIFRFQNGKSESLFLQRKNPRKISWTVLYRRQHKKGISEEVAKKRTRRTVKNQRAIVGASLDVIKERRSQRPEARAAARAAAIKEGKAKKSESESEKKANKAKNAASAAKGQAGKIASKQGAKGPAVKVAANRPRTRLEAHPQCDSSLPLSHRASAHIIGPWISSLFALPAKFSTIVNEKSNAVPGPLLVMILPLLPPISLRFETRESGVELPRSDRRFWLRSYVMRAHRSAQSFQQLRGIHRESSACMLSGRAEWETSTGAIRRLSCFQSSTESYRSAASRCSRTNLDNGSTEWQRHIDLLGVKRILKVDTHRFDCCKSGSYQDTSFQVSRGTMCSYQDAAAYSRGVTVSISSEPSAMRTSAESCLSLAIFMQIAALPGSDVDSSILPSFRVRGPEWTEARARPSSPQTLHLVRGETWSVQYAARLARLDKQLLLLKYLINNPLPSGSRPKLQLK
ncbi:hypothetical protein KCU62_g203, partial [Aureobasidium sp. EXF-3399]